MSIGKLASECYAIEEVDLCKERVYRGVLIDHPKFWGKSQPLLTVGKGAMGPRRMNIHEDIFVTRPNCKRLGCQRARRSFHAGPERSAVG